jgi:hypothetical protein
MFYYISIYIRKGCDSDAIVLFIPARLLFECQAFLFICAKALVSRKAALYKINVKWDVENSQSTFYKSAILTYKLRT